MAMAADKTLMAVHTPPKGWPDAPKPAGWIEEEACSPRLGGAKRPACGEPTVTALRPCKDIAAQICADVAGEARHMFEAHGIAPLLVVVEVGDGGRGPMLEDLHDVDGATDQGFGGPFDPCGLLRPTSPGHLKAQLAERCGLRTRLLRFSEHVTEPELLSAIGQLMYEWAVHGVLVELPLPPHLDEQKVLSAVGPEKDVQGFHPGNGGLLCRRRGDPLAAPLAAAAVVEILLQSGVPLAGKEAVVLGRSSTVGAPVALMLQQRDCTVTVCHSQTRGVEDHVRRADVVVACVGRPGFVKGSWLKRGAVVVDVGMNSVSVVLTGTDEKCSRRRVVGDVCYHEAKEVGLVTPVPGGVGHVAMAVLLRNVVNLARHSMGHAKMQRGPPLSLGAGLSPQERAALRSSADRLHFEDIGLRVPQLLLPRPGVDPSKWACIACDQYTSQPKYWQEVRDLVGDAPSTLNLIFPEVYLDKGRDQEIIQGIHDKMREYEQSGVLQTGPPGMVLLSRKTPVVSSRNGLLVELDLDMYSYEKGSQSLVRATEMTIKERLPPRVAIRQRASVELPHILVLIDDPGETVIEPLVRDRDRYEKLYDFDLMKGAGRLTGHRVASRKAIEGAVAGLRRLADPELFRERYGASPDQGVLLFAVGDGNHSLATAKWCWEDLKRKGASPEHPARFALVELMNIHDPGLQFEPIHRLVFGVPPEEFLEDAKAFFLSQGLHVEIRRGDKHALHEAADGHDVKFRWGKSESAVLVIKKPTFCLAAATLSSWLDPYLARHSEASVDYVHGQEVIDERCAADDRIVGILLPVMDKNDLLKTVVQEGVLPRKTFSMGEADEKRFYMEGRRIVPETTFYRSDFFRTGGAAPPTSRTSGAHPGVP